MTELHGTTADWDKVKLGDGTEIAYRVHSGNGQGRVALVHALAMNGRFWDQVVPLVHAAEVLTFDCRGHGASSKPDQTYVCELFARDLEELLDHLGWDQAVVAGASMGGCVALAFAGSYPDRAAGLGLFDTTAWYGPDAPANWAARGQKGFEEGMDSLVTFQLDRWFSKSYAQANPQVVDNLIKTFSDNDRAAYRQTCLMLGAFDARRYLDSLSMPCEVVVGSEDKATPVAMARELAAGIASARLDVLPGIHHFSPIEAPEQVAASLNRLLA